MGERHRATEVLWQDDAECKGVSFDFTPSKEEPKSLDYVQSNWCNFCPVRNECLAYATVYHLSGYWGGTSTAERRRLSYSRNRIKCPLCAGKTLVRVEGTEICLSCGVSWRIPQPQPQGATG